MTSIKKRYGGYALITGASSGIGKEFAKQLAAQKINLILVARREDRLKALAEQLSIQNQIDVRTIVLDLSKSNAVVQLYEQTKGIDIGLVIPNAGMENHGNFLNGNLENETKLLQLNTVVPMQIARLYGEDLAKRKRGGILFVSSTFGFQPVPYFSNYAASKSYISTLGQGLRVELKKSGVDVSVLAPGLTITEMTQDMPGMNFKKMPIMAMSSRRVVKRALRRMGKSSMIIAGKWNTILDAMGKYTTPRAMLAGMFGFLVHRAMDKKLTRYAG